MAGKLQINQSIKVLHDALTTHLNSFKSQNAFDYYCHKDGFGIYHFYLRLTAGGYVYNPRAGSLGFIRLRSLSSKLTEMVIEDSPCLQEGPDLGQVWEDQMPMSARKTRAKALFGQLRSMHEELREHIFDRLHGDRLLPDEDKNEARLSAKRTASIRRPTRVFINYAHEDIQSALKLYEQLKATDGISPWFDKESILPGMKWRPAIKKAIRESDFFLALLSTNSTTKKGYVQTEMKQALEIWDQFPEDKAYLIPVRLNLCEPSYEKLREVQFQDFFPSWDKGFQKIVEVINSAARPKSSAVDSSTGYEYRCAIVDLDNGLANLPQVCHQLNAIQKFFHFSYPSLPYKHTALREFEGQTNLYVPALPRSFYSQKVLLNADLAACLTKYLLAFKEDRKTYYDYLSLPSDIDDTFLFITTHGLYEIAKKVGCTFEKSIVYHVLTQLLIHFASDLGFHTEVKGCLLDFCDEHLWMIKGMKKMRLCANCTEGIENEELKDAVLAILANPLKV
jgi:hypothetical protein